MPILNPWMSLTFGALDLMGRDKSLGYWFEAIEGYDRGNPAPVEVTLTSFLQDGTITSIQSYNNRTMTLTIAVCATTTAGLARGEAALAAEVGRRNLLVYTPPEVGGVLGVPCVFDVVSSSFDGDTDDVREIQALERIYKVTVSALPFARASQPVEVTVGPPPNTSPVVTTVDACNSTTGWTADSQTEIGGLTVTASGGSVSTIYRNDSGVDQPNATAVLVRSGLALNTSTKKYLRIDFTATGTGRIYYLNRNTVYANGTELREVARNGTVGWYLVPFSSVTTVAVKTMAGLSNNAKGYVSVTVADVSLSDMPQDATGARQRFLTLPVGGSVRTQGDLALEDPTTALGSTLIYTTPITSPAVQPPLRGLRSAGSAESADASLVSGKYSDLGTLHTFDIPASQVPAGGYLLMVRVKNPTGTTYGLTWAGKSYMGTTVLDTDPPHGITGGAIVANTWTMVAVGHMTLPTFDLGIGGKVRIELQGSPAGLLLDEAWLFNLDQGRLTWVECGTTTPGTSMAANRLWMDAASLESPVPKVMMGSAADRSDAFGAGVRMQSFGDHQFTPPSTNVFVVTSNSVATGITLTSYPRFHSHVVSQESA